jgi:hypothetical protein
MILNAFHRRRETWEVTPTTVSPQPRATSVAFLWVALTLLFFVVAGCSEDLAGAKGKKVTGKYGLDRSEYTALRKAKKNPEDFKKALVQKQIEELKEQGIDVKTTPTGKVPKRVR